MKNLQSYDQFLNEANEEIKAQGACRDAMFIAQKEIDKFFKGLLADGHLDKYSSKIKPYNLGYKMDIDAKVSKSKYLNSEKAGNFAFYDYLDKLVNINFNVFIQPRTFFEDYFDRGTSSIDYYTLDNCIKGKTPKSGDIVIKTKSDIPKIAKQYLDITKASIADIEEHLIKINEMPA